MKNSIIIIIAIAFSALFQSCQKDNINNHSDFTSQINAYPKEPLSADETKSLLQMREEEKLVHDVYITLYNKWKVNVFTNIASSEQTHTDAVLTLLNRYELKDPVGNHTVGVFMDSTLQTLYNQLVALGSTSLLAAFKVGATIEDLDIYDLNTASLKVDNQDIKFVYANLTKGSRNHMRSFYSQIIGSGGTYSAQFITQSELDAIINSPKETGSF